MECRVHDVSPGLDDEAGGKRFRTPALLPRCRVPRSRIPSRPQGERKSPLASGGFPLTYGNFSPAQDLKSSKRTAFVPSTERTSVRPRISMPLRQPCGQNSSINSFRPLSMASAIWAAVRRSASATRALWASSPSARSVDCRGPQDGGA